MSRRCPSSSQSAAVTVSSLRTPTFVAGATSGRPLAEHQVVRQKLARMATELAAARLLRS